MLMKQMPRERPNGMLASNYFQVGVGDVPLRSELYTEKTAEEKSGRSG